MGKFTEISTKMYLEGLKDEEMVMELTKKVFKCPTYRSTKNEDVFMHVDLWCIKNNKRYGIDVKGLHKNKRSDNNYDDTIQWIELLNTQGNIGWIYGKSVYIAFITKTSVLYVPRKKIVKMVEEKIKGKEIVHYNPQNCYQPYQRRDRLDKIVKVPTDDLRKIAKHEIMLNK